MIIIQERRGFPITNHAELSQMLTRLTYKVIAFQGKKSNQDLSESQIFLLRLLDHHGTMRCSELAEELQITMPAVTNLANKLVRKGYVQREVPEHDRRLILLSITPIGQEVLNLVNRLQLEAMQSLWVDFTDSELKQLFLSFHMMNDRLEDLAEATN